MKYSTGRREVTSIFSTTKLSLFHQDDAGKSKRVQSIGELPGLVPSTGSPHPRPSISAINASESQELEDGVASLSVNVADASSNKSPLNASSSEYFVVEIEKMEPMIHSNTFFKVPSP